jgi:hypothetical protein
MQASTLKFAGASLALAALVAGCSEPSSTNSNVPTTTEYPMPRLASILAADGELSICKYTVAIDDASLSSSLNPPVGTPSSGTFTASIKSGDATLLAPFTGGGSVVLSWPTDNNCVKVATGATNSVVTVTETPAAGTGLAFYRIVTNANGGTVDSYDVPGIQTTPFSLDVTIGAGVATEVWFKNMPAAPNEGCTLTQGYWKTHSIYGPAPKADPTWATVGGPDASFFGTSASWYQVFNTPPAKGNVYYVLAHQYMAAVLNDNAGTSTTPAVDAAMTWAFDAFTANPNPASAFWVTNKATATGYAATLDSYNNGLIGPGHCGDEATR